MTTQVAEFSSQYGHYDNNGLHQPSVVLFQRALEHIPVTLNDPSADQAVLSADASEKELLMLAAVFNGSSKLGITEQQSFICQDISYGHPQSNNRRSVSAA